MSDITRYLIGGLSLVAWVGVTAYANGAHIGWLCFVGGFAIGAHYVWAFWRGRKVA